MPLHILIFGPPGAGKGTVSEFLVKEYGFVHLSAGNLLRAEVEKNSRIGREVRHIISEGLLIPDETIVKLILERLKREEELEMSAKNKNKINNNNNNNNNDDDDDESIFVHGVLLDGFPRTFQQAKSLHAGGIKVDLFLFLDVPGEILTRRCLARRVDPVTGKIYNLESDPPPEEIMSRLVIRSDDTREKHERRMEIYEEQKKNLVQFYSKVLYRVNGNQSIQGIRSELKSKMNELIRAQRKKAEKATHTISSKL